MIIERALQANLISQIKSMVAAGRWPRDRPAEGYMRGVDFYDANGLLSAIVVGAQMFKNAHGYIPPLSAPVSYSERLYARKYFAPLPLPSLADKLEGQAYVRARLGDAFLPSVVWIGDSVDELCAAALPPGRFVLKANHGWRYNLILTLPGDLATRREEIDRLARAWLASRFGYDTGEWQYCTFKPRLFLERFIDFNGEDAPDEFKLYCFHGRVQLINFHCDRFTGHRSALYDTDWNLLPVNFGREAAYRERPGNLHAIISVAERIAAGLAFARVDLYSDGQGIKFSEITFTPGNARSRLSDPEFGARLGKLLEVGL
jgi:hypothetical protein